MTNDELNGWLNLWYYKEVLKECVHEWYRYGHNNYRCDKCKVNYKAAHKFQIKSDVLDYLNDPAVILGIIKKHKLVAAPTEYLYKVENGKYTDRYSGYKIYANIDDIEYANKSIADDKSLERAVMLALKAKRESEGLNDGSEI